MIDPFCALASRATDPARRLFTSNEIPLTPFEERRGFGALDNTVWSIEYTETGELDCWRFLGDGSFVSDLATNQGLPPGEWHEYLDAFAFYLNAVEGDFTAGQGGTTSGTDMVAAAAESDGDDFAVSGVEDPFCVLLPPGR